MSIFEQAVRNKVRFATSKGSVSVEDLWDMPLTSKTKFNLDTLAQALHRQLQDTSVESFVTKTNTINKGLQLQFDLVKHVIEVKLQEKTKREDATRRLAKKQEIMGIIAHKEAESLRGTSIEDLRKMLEDL